MDLRQHLLRQMAFSRATFGPGERTAGVCDHIRKEIAEVLGAQNPLDRADEWVDVVILGLDGLTRAIRAAGMRSDAAAEEAVAMILRKQAVNEGRDWPDWRTSAPNEAIQHIKPTP